MCASVNPTPVEWKEPELFRHWFNNRAKLWLSFSLARAAELRSEFREEFFLDQLGAA